MCFPRRFTFALGENYATLLKLDVPQIMAVLTDELAGRKNSASHAVDGCVEHAARPADVSALETELEIRNGRSRVLGIVLIVAFASFAWRHHKHTDSLAGLQPAVYQSANSGQTLPLVSHH